MILWNNQGAFAMSNDMRLKVVFLFFVTKATFLCSTLLQESGDRPLLNRHEDEVGTSHSINVGCYAWHGPGFESYSDSGT